MLDVKVAKHALKERHTCWNLSRHSNLIPLKFVPCVGCSSWKACPYRASRVLEAKDESMPLNDVAPVPVLVPLHYVLCVAFLCVKLISHM